MSRHINIFKSASDGLNTKVDPVRLKFDYRTGVSALAACKNISIDDTGRISRRAGYAVTDRTEAWHSLFSAGAFALGVTGNALAVIAADMSKTNLRNVTTGAKMSYVRNTDGAQDIIFYMNGYEKGRLINKVSYSWPVGTYVGPETRKSFYEAPIGHLLCIRNLRMFIAEDKILWYSEPGNLSSYRLSANYFGFPSRLRMVQAVKTGLWISDSESLYFLQGEIIPSRLEMPTQTLVANYPAIEGTAVKIDGSRIGEGIPGAVIVFTTSEGVCIGDGNGNLINISERKIDLPLALSGASLYRDGHYCVTLN